MINNFGKETYSEDGTYNRAYIANIVFNDQSKLDKLNALVHPKVIEYSRIWASNHQHLPYVIKEAALFFESGSSFGAHKIIGVSAPKSLRINRVMKRDHCTKEEVEKRMMHQIEESLKMKLCDWVIINDDQQLVLPQVIELNEKILATL